MHSPFQVVLLRVKTKYCSLKLTLVLAVSLNAMLNLPGTIYRPKNSVIKLLYRLHHSMYKNIWKT